MKKTVRISYNGRVHAREFDITDRLYKENEIFEETENQKIIFMQITTASLESFGQTGPGFPGMEYDYYYAKLNIIDKNNAKNNTTSNYYFATPNKNYR